MPYLDVNETSKIHYEIYDFSDPWAQAETIFFIHGFTENLSAWNAWVPHLSRKYRLILFDIRGFGKSSPIYNDQALSTDLLVDDLVTLIQKLSGKPVHLISGKSGAITAMHLAAEHPELVRSLVLACPPIYAPGSAEWLPFMEANGVRAWAKKTMPARLGKDATEVEIDWWSDMMGETTLDTVRSYLSWVVTTKPWLDLIKIKCPTLIISTKFSEKTNSAAGLTSDQDIKEKLPQAQFFTLDKDCYHAAASDPDVCAAKTLEFLATVIVS